MLVSGVTLPPRRSASAARFSRSPRRGVARKGEAAARGLGRLVANTVGAGVGVLGSVYLVLPAFGIVGGSLALAALGVGAAILAAKLDTDTQRPAEAV